MNLENEIGSITTSLADKINKASTWYILLGILLIAAGVAMLAYPLYSGLAITKVLGVVLVIAGAVYLLNSLMARGAGGFLFRILLGAVYIAAGLWMLTQPLEGLTALSVLLGITLGLGGILRILFARVLTGVPGVGMVLLSGLVSIVLAILIFAKLPVASQVAVGILVGIDFISSGSSLTWVAIQAKRVSKVVAAAG